MQVARDARLVVDDLYNATLAASVITILLNGIALRYFGPLLDLKQEETVNAESA